MKNQLVIVINGQGGVGKDTLCAAAAEHFKVVNVSAITPIKEIASQHGWNGEKDAASRRFLAMLKQAFCEYNDLPNRYLLEQYEAFAASDAEILFVHIREGEQIEHFVQTVGGKCVTLLIRGRAEHRAYGNAADDEVEAYAYDFYYDNVQSLEDAPADFLAFLNKMIASVQ